MRRAASPAPDPPAPPAPHLAAMFTAVVASLDTPTRRHLAEVVSFCHTRRHPVADARATPILFYPARDHLIQSTALPHLAALEPHHPPRPLHPPPPSLTPFNDAGPALSESSLLSRMDDDTRSRYLLARFCGYGREVVELGYRYFHHLARPDLPLKDTIRQLPVDDNDDRRPAPSSDIDDDFSDDEMVYSDDDDDSFCSHMSDVTQESQLSQPQFLIDNRCPPAPYSDTSPDYSLPCSSLAGIDADR